MAVIKEFVEGDNTDLRIISGKKQKSLTEILPPNWVFKRVPPEFDDNMGATYNLKEIWYRPERLHSWRGQLVLLHEISHAQAVPDVSLFDDDERGFIKESEKYDGLNAFEEKILEENIAQDKLEGLDQEELNRLIASVFSKNRRYRTLAYMVVSGYYEREKAAYDGALQISQDLKREGFDITKGIPKSDIERWRKIKLYNHRSVSEITLAKYGLDKSRLACRLRAIEGPTSGELNGEYSAEIKDGRKEGYLSPLHWW